MTCANKPYAESCDQNREPILAIIEDVFNRPMKVLEIGSGTGQHAVYFGARLPHVTWQPTDQAEALPGIEAWRREAGLSNVLPALELDVTRSPWPVDTVHGVFSANTAHIMAWPAVTAMFAGIGRVLTAGGCFCLYGPFNRHGQYTSESNARFDAWLQARDPESGIRDMEALEELGRLHGLGLQRIVPMPANNFILLWSRQ